MQSKIYNAYRITHKNGDVEDINALDLIQALENMDIQETESKVLQAFLVKENVRTLVADEPSEILFTAVADTAVGGSIATPASGKIHVGDEIALRAIPARNYAFVEWQMNGATISTNASLVYTMPELTAGLDTAVFTAKFKLADIAWTATVSPAEATGAGAVAFPLSGTTEANEDVSLIAVEAGGYTFSHWERNGQNIGTSKILSTVATPLAEGEASAVYTAVFTQ